jgi:hypothetical protein
MRRGTTIGIGLLGVSVALGSCGPQLVDTYDACDLTADLSAPSAFPGASVAMTGGPFTTTWDTLVQLDGVLAQVTEVSFAGDTCSDCADCRAAALSCGDCTQRCQDCVSSVSFVVPAVGAGPTEIVLTNSYGSTGSLPFEVLGAVDTGGTTGTTTGETGGSGTPVTGGTGTGATTSGSGSGAGGSGSATTPDTGGSGN